MNFKKQILFILIVLLSLSLKSITLVKPQSSDIYNYSGDNQTQTTGEIIEHPFRVLVSDKNGNPVCNHELVFTIISYPQKSGEFKLDKQIIFTDSLGLAENYFLVGNKSGDYQILVSSNEVCDANTLVYTVHGRESTWTLFLVIGLLGGLALFLYGMDVLSKGMQTAAGNQMRSIIAKFTQNRVFALFAGIFVTVMVQSSSVTSVMLVGFVQAGLMSFAQTLGILLGAGIGTTVTAQLIAFKVTDYSLLIIAIGFGFIVFFKKVKLNNIGRAILGFGLLFFGMYIMSEAMYPLRSYQGFIDIMIRLENPWIGIFVGFLITALIQSSSAFLGIMITIASQGFLSLEACIPMVLGTNLGTGITAILASLNSGRAAKRVAFAHTFFKLIGVLIFVWWIPDYADFVRSFSPKIAEGTGRIEALSQTVPRQIANAHTVFSIGLAIVLLPLLNILSKLIIKLIPDKAIPERYKLKYIDKSINSSPAIALSLAKKETERMGNKVKKMISLSLKPFIDKDETVLEKWQQLKNESDFLKENINKYLISVSSENSDEHRLNEAFQIMYVVKELEMIGDIINTNLRKQSIKWQALNAEFSDEGKAELAILNEKAIKQISRSMQVFSDVNLEKAEHVKQKFKKYALLAEEYEKQHYSRLISNNEKSAASSEVHLELLGLYNAVNRHATNISTILLNWNVDKK